MIGAVAPWRARRGQAHGRQRGFTLIELMVALLVSSLLVGMILAIFARMSIAYRGQQQIAGVQQVLAAARASLELDAKQAGLGMPQGFTTMLAQNQPMSAVQIADNAGSVGPDQVAFFYGDPSTQALVTDRALWPTSVVVDQATGFAVNDLIVMTTAGTPTAPVTGGALVAQYTACVLQIASITGTTTVTIRFSTAAPWGQLNQPQCSWAPPSNGSTMIYKFVAHAYRIDPTATRLALGVLQQAPITGGLLGTAADGWTDLAYGFTDLQVALRVYDADATDQDGDSDALRDWYSGALMASWTKIQASPKSPLQISLSLVARTDRTVEGISSTATPNLTSATLPDYNSLGNRASIDLTATSDPALTGARIFRYTTFQVDLRNLGIGR